MKEIKDKIKEAREEYSKISGKKMTQFELGEKIGCTDKMISRYENGNTEVPLEVLRKIAEHTGKPISWFFDEEATAPEIKTVADVITRIEQLQNAFHACYSVEVVPHPHDDIVNYSLELTFDLPISYEKVFNDLAALHNARLAKAIPDKVADLWYKAIVDEQSKINVNDML